MYFLGRSWSPYPASNASVFYTKMDVEHVCLYTHITINICWKSYGWIMKAKARFWHWCYYVQCHGCKGTSHNEHDILCHLGDNRENSIFLHCRNGVQATLVTLPVAFYLFSAWWRLRKKHIWNMNSMQTCRYVIIVRINCFLPKEKHSVYEECQVSVAGKERLWEDDTLLE